MIFPKRAKSSRILYGGQPDIGFKGYFPLNVVFQCIAFPLLFLFLFPFPFPFFFLCPWNIEARFNSEQEPSSNTLEANFKLTTKFTQVQCTWVNFVLNLKFGTSKFGTSKLNT